MKALRINDYGAPLHLDEVPIPTAGPGQVLVENDFTSLNGVDPGRGLGFLRHVFPLQFPWTPGGDVAGGVAAVGQGITAFRVGDGGLWLHERGRCIRRVRGGQRY